MNIGTELGDAIARWTDRGGSEREFRVQLLRVLAMLEAMAP